MPDLTFEELTAKIQQHFTNETYTEGLSFASKHLPDFPEEFALINYWRICLAARLGERDLANTILESTLASGLWYSNVLLRQSPSLEVMQGEGEFERLVEISQKLQDADLEIPLLAARPENACGPEDVGCPAIFFLHSNMDSAQNSLKHLGALSYHGWVVAAPQSTHSMYTGAYMWTDYKTTKSEMDGHFENLTKRYNLDEAQIVFSGFSMGAEMALEMVLTGDYPAQGFILLGPGGPKMDQVNDWLPLIDRAASRSLRGVVMMGLDDTTIPQENIRSLVQMLNEHNIPTKLVTFEGLAHDFPPDTEQVFVDALAFITGAADN
ncbi:MAG TPA: dienelactone hydrolase family protein [Anaerolineales bacterium]|nr:dienelactone hydrolase family protein [Anaerolineales bacterium]